MAAPCFAVRTVISNPLILFTVTTSLIDIIITQASPYKKPRIYADYGSEIIHIFQNLPKSAQKPSSSPWIDPLGDHILDGAADCLAMPDIFLFCHFLMLIGRSVIPE
jgi:hypothetical protein